MRISSIECGRVVAILAVMTIHLSPFSNPFDPALWDGTPYPLVGAVINQLCRCSSCAPVTSCNPPSPRATR